MARSPWLTSVWGPGANRLIIGAGLAVLGIAAVVSGSLEKDVARIGLGCAALAAGLALGIWGFRRSRAARYFGRSTDKVHR